MIKTNELRIGNLVNYCNNVQTISVVYKNAVSFEFILEEIEVYKIFSNENIFGIPLTEEIFLKYGFRKTDNKTFYDDIYNLMFVWNGSNFSFEKGEYSIVDITYLHQLQNLYFVLTNSEIDINL